MRIKHRYLTWDNSPKRIKQITKILDDYSVKYLYKEDLNCVLASFRYQLEFMLYEDVNSFNEIQNQLKPFEIMRADVSAEFDKKDMETAEYYEIYAGEYQYPQPDNDFEYLNHTFDLTNYCSHCGIGKIQNHPFRLKHEPKQKNSQFLGLFWERDAIFVREETKNILTKESIKGIHFMQPVLHNSNKPVDKFYQLIIETELEKGLDTSNANIEVCKFNDKKGKDEDKNEHYCGRIKYNYEKADICILDKKIFPPDIDFCVTNEYFGSGSYAGKVNIISKKVYEIIKNNHLRGLKISPILHKNLSPQIINLYLTE